MGVIIDRDEVMEGLASSFILDKVESVPSSESFY